MIPWDRESNQFLSLLGARKLWAGWKSWMVSRCQSVRCGGAWHSVQWWCRGKWVSFNFRLFLEGLGLRNDNSTAIGIGSNCAIEAWSEIVRWRIKLSWEIYRCQPDGRRSIETFLGWSFVCVETQTPFPCNYGENHYRGPWQLPRWLLNWDPHQFERWTT